MAVPKRKKCKSRACIRININKFKRIMLKKIINTTVKHNIFFFKKLKTKNMLLL